MLHKEELLFEPTDQFSALNTDFYELTMAGGFKVLEYLKYTPAGGFDTKKLMEYKFGHDLYFRHIPEKGGYCICAGLGNAMEFLSNVHFSESDIKFLESLPEFSQIHVEEKKKFLEYLANWRFTGDVWAIPEGEVVFQNNTLLRVVGNPIDTHLVEGTLLNIYNAQTRIATKASRICQAADGDPVADFSFRRMMAGTGGTAELSRALVIGGMAGTSNTYAAKKYRLGRPLGTHAHSWVLAFGNDKDAFEAYSLVYPHMAAFLGDTYDYLKKGMVAAIEEIKKLREKGYNQVILIRDDSGDLAERSIEARDMLDRAGLENVKLIASNNLDEYHIQSLKKIQGAKLDVWGVGTMAVTPPDSLGCVYKETFKISPSGKILPTIKISGNVTKTTIPGPKWDLRLINEKNQYDADVLIHDSQLEESETRLRYTFYDLTHRQLHTMVDGLKTKLLQVKVMEKGKVIYDGPIEDTLKIRENTLKNLSMLHPGHKRLENPHTYRIGLSKTLFTLREKMIEEERMRARV